MKIYPNIKDDIYIPEFERIKGFELSSKIKLNNLNIIWQVLYKGFKELQNGSHLFQHGEMIIIRVIYLFDGPNPEDLLKKLENSQSDKDISKSNTQIKKNEIENDKIINFNNNNSKNIDDKNTEQNIQIKDFRQFVEMFFKNREGLIHTKLYNEVALISFKEGEVTLNISKVKDNHFNKTVSKLISKWTGRIWQIHSSTSNLGKSLYEEDILNQQKEIELMKNHHGIKKILNEFSNSKIHSITELTEVNKNNEEITVIRSKKEK